MAGISRKGPIEIHRSKIEIFLMSIKEFSQKNSRKVILSVSIVIFVLLAVLLAYTYLSKTSEKDLVRFEIIIENYRIDPANQEVKDKTIAELQKLISETKFGFVHEMSYYYLGNIYFNENKFSESYNFLSVFIKKSSSNDVFIPLAVNKSAICLEEMGKLDDAITLLTKFEEKHADSIVSDQINYNIARLYFIKNNQVKAREYFSSVITRYPKSIYADRSRERLLLLSAVK
jgi:tetratricopeptide (TPR) repeat protein